MGQGVTRESRRPTTGRVAWAALALLLLAAPAHADTVLRADGESLFGRVRMGEKPGVLVLERPGRPRTELPLEEIVGVDFGRETEAERIQVVLHSGERLAGKVSLAPPDRVRVSRQGGPVILPLAACETILLGSSTPAPGSRGDGSGGTTVLLTNGDRISGSVVAIRNGKLLLKTPAAQLPIDLARIEALVLPAADRPPRPVREADAPAGAPGASSPRVLLELVTGEILAGEGDVGGEAGGQGSAGGARGETFSIRTSWGARLAIPLESIGRLMVQNGRFQFLSDLRPVAANHTPYLDTARPHRVNESVSGGPLRLGGTRFSRGLGVHARSDLTYELAGAYQLFAAVIGVDAAVGGAGSVIFKVLGDDRVLYESPVLRGGDVPLPIRVDVRGVLLLRLVVDFADNGDLADHANWANAHLLR
jgi:hypothetical protein